MRRREKKTFASDSDCLRGRRDCGVFGPHIRGRVKRNGISAYAGVEIQGSYASSFAGAETQGSYASEDKSADK